MSNTTPSAPPTAPSTPAPSDGGPTKEVRFAVVMYGGVSLCIYINGIAQELLHMVRATAPGDTPGTLRYTDDQLSPIEQVYRDLGRLLCEDRIPDRHPEPGDPVRARFSVDILSGTSAGGINSIFLAKALAGDGSMAQLKQLWMTEADIAKLINDGASVRDTRLPRPGTARALLNGQRMYQKLVEAFDGMDRAGRPADAPAAAPLVPELDLFVTTTDIAGVTLPIRLSDGVVHERRHRGVFHFHLRPEPAGTAAGVRRDPHDHFIRDYNPFLAFAARCTSAFPFAFEPMRLQDITEVLNRTEGYEKRDDWHADPRWDPFLDRFRTPAATSKVDAFARSFGDGGYLDNKPFSYASESLLRRESGIPVDRKLIYIEPKPEHPEHEPARTEFDAIENVMAATVGLPRYETIREDLERVVARNRLTERVRTITRQVERDIEYAATRQRIEDPGEWRDRYLDVMVRDYGVAYGGYHRLRVAATTDWLARVLARASGIGDASDHVLALRHLVRAWREKKYTPEPPQAGQQAHRLSENHLLLDFDLAFRVRRLAYITSKIDALYRLDREAHVLVSLARKDQMVPDDPAAQAEFRDELRDIKGQLYGGLLQMRAAEERLLLRRDANELHAAIDRLDVQPADLERLLELSDAARDERALELLAADGRETQLQALANTITGILADARVTASTAVKRLLETPAYDLPPMRQLARRVLWHYYRHYGDYDLVAFPILYSTDASEEDTVDIIRISPEDARFIYDENTDALGRRKLAGTAVFNFGGFLRDTWRANDILWGRLDGAERLICSLLPDEADRTVRERLLERASVAILGDEFKQATRGEVSELMSRSLVSVAAGRPADSAVAQLSAGVDEEQLAAVFGDCMDDGKLLTYFRQGYEVNRDLDPREALDALARGSRVVGRMLEGISERRSVEGKRVRWVTRAATWFWGVVQVAVPRSLPALVFDHWLGLLYALALLQVLVGVFAGPVVMGWGVRLLAVTLAANLVVVLLRDYMRSRGVWAAWAMAALVLAAAGVVVAGVASIAENVVTRGGVDRALAALPVGPWSRTTGLHVLCGAMGVLMVLAAAIPLLRRRYRGWLPGGFSAPGLAAEFVAGAEELAMLTRGILLKPIARAKDETDAQRAARIARVEAIRTHGPVHREIPGRVLTGVYVDYVFIAAYWLLFVLLADRLLALVEVDRRVLASLATSLSALLQPAGATIEGVIGVVTTSMRMLGVGALVTGTAAALLDLVENGRIHEAFTAGVRREQKWMADGIRTAALWKWSLVFATVLLLSPLFIWSGAPGVLLALFWVVVAVAGLLSLWRAPRRVEWVMILLGLGLLAAAFLVPAA